MKIIFLPLLITILAVSAAGVGKRSQPPFAIHLTADKPTVKTGSGIWVRIQMTNTSDHDVNCAVHASNGVDRNYRFDVRNSAGNLTARRIRKHPELEGAGSFRLCTLRPGQSTSADESLVSRLFDMSQPGQYVIRVFRRNPNDSNDSEVGSNSIIITVAP